MSKEAAREFLKKVAEDPKLQQQLVAFAREQGYQFTVEELTADELGQVAGGALNAYFKYDSSIQLSTVKLNTTISPDLSLQSLDKI